MANYTRQQDFSVKDALTTGDPDKVIKGSEVDEEFDALVTSSASKIDVVTGHTTNNLASLNSVGMLQDSGVLKTDVAELSGSVYTGDLTLSGAPTSDLHAATKVYVDEAVAIAHNSTVTAATTTTTIPNDDTIPQSTEGVEVITQAITPRATTNKLVIDVQVHCSFSTNGKAICVALFQDTTANALAAALTASYIPAGDLQTIRLTHVMDAGTTSATTFKVRAGADDTGTLTINGSGGARRLGGVLASTITIREFLQ